MLAHYDTGPTLNQHWFNVFAGDASIIVKTLNGSVGLLQINVMPIYASFR